MSSVLVLCGPTAAGKTSLLVRAAEMLHREGGPPVEVISADSRQVYRHMSIGTALPSREELQIVPHHLVSCIDPREQFDVARFLRHATRLVSEIHRRGALPVIAGGTGFYLRAFLCGLPQTPPGDPEVRRHLEDRLQREGLEVMREELAQRDPHSWKTIDAADQYRILRALEIWHVTGKPRSAFTVPRGIRRGLDAEVMGVERERQDLHLQIARRVAAMMADGLPREVQSLMDQGYHRGDPGLRTIGYREFFADAEDPPWSPRALERIAEQIVFSTRRYARRQFTYLRRLPEIKWVHSEDLGALMAALRRITISATVESI